MVHDVLVVGEAVARSFISNPKSAEYQKQWIFVKEMYYCDNYE
jgi:hypothetical protein